MDGLELTYSLEELQILIPASDYVELKRLTGIVFKERFLFSEIALARIARMLSQRTVQLGTPESKLPFLLQQDR